MTTPSKAAKAAAILAFTSGISDTDKAVELYDALTDNEERFSSIFPSILVWDPLSGLTDAEWWNEVCMLADSIDNCHQFFKER